MRAVLKDRIRSYYTGNAIYANKQIRDKKYDLIIAQGVCQYFSDSNFVSFLKSMRELLTEDGHIVLKEQYTPTPTTYLSESRDWMRSIGCFTHVF